MNYRILSSALVALLVIPCYSFADTADLTSEHKGATSSSAARKTAQEHEKHVQRNCKSNADHFRKHNTRFYGKIQYNGEFFNNIGDLSSDVDNYSTAYGLKKNAASITGLTEADVVTYDPEYSPSYFGGSLAIGYSFSHPIRIEVEALYSEVKIDDDDYIISEAAQWLSLANSTADAVNTGASIRFMNEKISTFAGMFNAYYDIKSPEMPVSPYIGVGLGLAGVKFLDTVRHTMAYQAKAGVMYSITPEIDIFAGYRYFGLFSDKFKDVKTLNGGTATAAGGIVPIKADVEDRFGVHGLEAGLIFKFF